MEEVIWEFWCPGCNTWMAEALVHDDGACIHAPGILARRWRVSRDRGKSWKEQAERS